MVLFAAVACIRDNDIYITIAHFDSAYEYITKRNHYDTENFENVEIVSSTEISQEEYEKEAGASNSEDNGVINTLIKGYNDVKLFFIEKFSDMDFFSIEAPFIDDEFITQNIMELEKLYASVSKELKQYKENSNDDNYYLAKIHDITSRRNNVAVHLAFYLSLDSQQVNKGIQLLNDIDDDFKICLNAIVQYINGDFNESLETSFIYVKTIGRIPEHYLFNRNISEMLMRNLDYKKAIPFLSRAAEKKPDELDLHKMLLTCYKHEHMSFEIEIEEQIIEILGV